VRDLVLKKDLNYRSMVVQKRCGDHQATALSPPAFTAQGYKLIDETKVCRG
jgi:hypothetical protein